jgi:hypothetical protein
MKRYKMQSNQYSVIFTFKRVNNFIKVNAIDEGTGRDVSICVPLNVTKEDMKNLALKKLTYVLKNKPKPV